MKKKKVTVRAESFKGWSLPAAVRGRGKGLLGAMEGVGVYRCTQIIIHINHEQYK